MTLEETIKEFHHEWAEYRRTGKSVEGLYDKWASQYDQLHPTGKFLNSHTATTLSNFFEKKSGVKVVDIACGSGMTSKYLKQMGFDNIDGFDLSQQMVNVSMNTGYFRSVSTGCIGDEKKLSCDDNAYDAVVCISGISVNHILIKNALREFYRILKQGGIAVYSINENVHISHIFEVHQRYFEEQKFEFLLMEKRFHFENVEAKINEQCYFCALRKV